MFEISSVKLDGESFLGLRAELPNSPPLVLVVGNKGFVMCGYLNLESAERLGAAAAVVTGVKTVDDVLKAEIRSVTSKAKELGLTPGAVVKNVLGKLA
jgi:uncharacterized protein YunC (DUF1805 family)